MQTKVQKWGNSLALRIPKPLALDARLSQGAAVELSLHDGKLVIEPSLAPKYRLDELLARVTKKNRHTEVDTGRPTGREAW
jgi:antitoxin MazE